MFSIHELNESQHNAVIYNDGPALVIAGAGSGKTRVLTYKIAFLLAHGIPAGNILALTFTNKAAREMKERICRLVGEQTARYLWMGTFHSICARILRREADRLGYSHDFSIYDSNDSKSLIKRIIKEMGLDDKVYKVGHVAARISMAKNNMLTPADYAANSTLEREDKINRVPLLPQIFLHYNTLLRTANAMDFDDLLFNMNILLYTQPDIRSKYQEGFQYVFVDEYQDTNHSQYQIVKTLAAPQDHLCVVGDDAQSIYSFRGASIEHILRFQAQYPNARLFKLERNYRSTQNIVNAANSLIKKNEAQIPKEVYSENETGEPLQLSMHENDAAEASFIVEQIQKLHRKQQADYNHFVILYRTNAQSRPIEEELHRRSIPYRVYGSTSFYQRKEIKDAISYLNLIVNPDNEEALLRIVNIPARGIGDTTMKKVVACARKNETNAMRIMQSPTEYELDVSAATQTKLLKFVTMIQELREQSSQLNAYDFAQEVLNKTRLLQNASIDRTPEGQDRYENLQAFLAGIHEFTEDRLKEEGVLPSISDFLAEVSLQTDQDQNLQDDTPHISLMTIHAAKGLEFPVVFIAGLEEKLFPSAFAESQANIEEERRLFYVAITRAQEKCYITYAGKRFRNGTTVFSTPSRFLKDIDGRYINQTTVPQQRPYWERDFFADYGQDALPDKHIKSSQRLTKTTGMQLRTEQTPIEAGFPVGCRVTHATFGNGKVVATYEENGNEKIEILFDTTGKKTLLLKFAKLSICE